MDILARKHPSADDGASSMEIRVAVIGNVDSGKSTMVGVLTRSILDDGRGFARSKVFKHGHEEATGRTSSIGQHNLCVRPCWGAGAAWHPRGHALQARVTRSGAALRTAWLHRRFPGSTVDQGWGHAFLWQPLCKGGPALGLSGTRVQLQRAAADMLPAWTAAGRTRQHPERLHVPHELQRRLHLPQLQGAPSSRAGRLCLRLPGAAELPAPALSGIVRS